MFAWGANSHGQLADVSLDDRHTPVYVQEPKFLKLVSGGGVFSAVANDKTIWAAGQLQAKESSPKQTTFILLGTIEDTIVNISCGWDFFVALTNSGKIFIWGRNSPRFKLANDLTPKWIDKISRLPLDGYNFTSVAAGLRHVVAVVDSNRVLEFKNGKMRDLNIDKSVKVNGCSAGAHHSLIWSDDGKVGVWGDNRFGQGGPLANDIADRPRKTDSVQWISSDDFNNEAIVDVQSGWSHVLVLTRNGKIYSWGRCDFGQLGRSFANPDSDPSDQSPWPQRGLIFDPAPRLVSIDTSSPIVLISAGAEHSLALTENGELWTWGWNEHGTCAVNPEEMENVLKPRRVVIEDESRPIRLAAAGYGFSMALMDE